MWIASRFHPVMFSARVQQAAPDGQQGQPSGRTPEGPEGQSTEEIGGAESTERGQL